VDKQSPLEEIKIMMEREDLGIAHQVFQKGGKALVRGFNGNSAIIFP